MNKDEQAADLSRLVPGDEARRLVLSMARCGTVERVKLSDAGNRVLAEDLAAKRTQPPFDASAMDGYALLSSDCGPSPFDLDIIGESAAGHPFCGTVSTGQTVRIFTGAPLPQGTDTIAIQENVEALANGKARILKAEQPGRFIRKAGLDFCEGDVLITSGTRLNPVLVSLAASMNHEELTVYKRPKVSLIATGDELVLPGETPGDGQIIASNSFGMAVLAQDLGAEVTDHGIAKDTETALADLGRKALSSGADLIITMGGASVGDHDLVLPVFQALGFRFHFTKIAMRPGKPFLFASCEHEGRRVILAGLAGNPVSSMVAAQVFIRPLIQALGGSLPEELVPMEGILGRDLPENDEREEYMRAMLEMREGRAIVTPVERQDSSMLATLSRANCLMIRPARASAEKAGAPCHYIPIR